ncbi:MAG TPA: transcriptional regulator GcvA [Azospirillaceae bacterium]|nr:transcriptional regulator GcvA [Azospirillaceae bacterium]
MSPAPPAPSAPPPLPPLAAVRVFEAAARLGSFTRAAGELGMTQAAVSYQIKILEERVGGPLFRRLPRQVVLTELGQRLAPAVTDALDTLRTAFAGARSDAGTILTISTTHAFASNWLAPRLGRFQLAHPGLALRLAASSTLVDFGREEVDVGIRAGHGDWPGLEAHRMFPVECTPLCSPDLLKRLGGLSKPTDLLNAPLLTPSDPWWRLWFKHAGVDTTELEAMPGLRIGNQQIEGMAALAGQGVAILSPALWSEELAHGRLVQPFDIVAGEGRSYWLVYPRAYRNTPKIRVFREWLLTEVSASSALVIRGRH